jgi:hypothetical protein
VVVECKYREMVGPFAALRLGPDFRGVRADIAVTSRTLPRRKSGQAAYPRLTATLVKQRSGFSRRGRYRSNSHTKGTRPSGLALTTLVSVVTLCAREAALTAWEQRYVASLWRLSGAV